MKLSLVIFFNEHLLRAPTPFLLCLFDDPALMRYYLVSGLFLLFSGFFDLESSFCLVSLRFNPGISLGIIQLDFIFVSLSLCSLYLFLLLYILLGPFSSSSPRALGVITRYM